MKYAWQCKCGRDKSATTTHLVKVEDEVQLAHVAKVPVEYFNVVVDDFEGDELVVAAIDTRYKVEAGVALVHKLGVFPVQKVAQLGGAGEDSGCDVTYDLQLLFLRHGGVPFRQSNLALPAEEQDKLYLWDGMPADERRAED